jgi:hypothetical protein
MIYKSLAITVYDEVGKFLVLPLDLLSLWRAQVKETTSAVVSLVSLTGNICE